MAGIFSKWIMDAKKWIMNAKRWIKFQRQHLKDCFATVTPSKDNPYFIETKGYQYECIQCGLVFQRHHVTKLSTCPCGSAAVIPHNSIPKNCRVIVEEIAASRQLMKTA